MTKYDYCFVYLNILDGVFQGADYELNSSYIRSYLKSRDVKSVQYIDLDGYSINEMVCGIKKTLCRYYVFYISDYNYYISKVVINKLASQIREEGIIVIGPVTEYIMRHFRHHVSADYYCYVNECDTLFQIIKGENGLAVEPTKTERVLLDEIPQPYSNGVVPAKEAVNMGLLSSKGCIGCCNFCSYSEKDAQCEFYPVEVVIRELKYIKDNIGGYGHKLFFYDDCFSGDKERTVRLCDAIIEAALGFKFWCCTRVDVLDELVIDKLALAGFENVVVGLESASERILSTLGKMVPTDTFQNYTDKLVRMCSYAKTKALNLVVSINFGLIGEQIEDAAQTLDFIQKNNISHISVNYMTIFPKSRIFVANDFRLTNCYHSPEELPMRTVYDRRMMCFVSKRVSLLAEELNVENAIRNQKRKAEIIGFYTGITFKQNKRFGLVEWDELKKRPKIIEKQSIHGYCVVDCEKISPDEVYSDNRKELKVKIERYDNVKKWAYQHDIYIEHILLRTIIDGQVYLKADNYLSGKILKYHFFGEHFLEKLQHIISKYSFFVGHTCLNFHQDIEDTLCDDMQAFATGHYTGELPVESRDVYEEFCSKYPYAYVFVNFCIFVAKNVNVDNQEYVLYAYSKLNSSIDNHMIRFPEDIVIAIIDNQAIVYNASLRLSYFCNEDDGRAVSAIIRKNIRKSDEDNVSLFAQRLVMRGFIPESCILREQI